MTFEELPKMTKNGDLRMDNAIVHSVSIDAERCLTAWLHLKFHGKGCDFGGRVLAKLNQTRHINGRDFCAEFLIRCMSVAGSRTWEGIAGKSVRCLHDGVGGGVVAIGHFLKDDWFCPDEEWADS